MKNCFFACAVLAFAIPCCAQRPAFQVLAFYSTTVEPDHVLFARDALKVFPELAARNHFAFEATTDWNKLDNADPKQYQVVLWLDDSPHTAPQRMGFERYMKNGGAWMGFHFAGYNDESTHWPWFADFLGGVFYDNSWPPLPALLRADSPAQLLTENLPQTFLSPANEWYGWKPNPRQKNDVHVFLTLDPANYPIGFKDVLTSGDVPVAWTNIRYKMTYLNMGHGDKILSNPVQNRLIAKAIVWLGNRDRTVRNFVRTKPVTEEPLDGLEISPLAAAVNPKTGKAYVVDSRNNLVTVIDGANGSSSLVKVGMDPVAIAVNPETNKIYVTNKGSATVSVINGASNLVEATVRVGSLPYVLAVNSVTNKIYVSRTFSNTITVIDGATNAVTPVQAIQADSIAINPRTNKIYLLGWEDRTVTVLDAATNAVSKMPAGLHLWGSAVNPATNMLYVANAGSGSIGIIDGATGAVHTVNTGRIPCAVAVDSPRNRIYAVNYGDETLTAIDGASQSAIATVRVGPHPQAVAVDTKSNRIYVANTHGDSVTVIDGATHTVLATKPAGKNPFALAVDEIHNKIYAADMAGRNVTVIDGP